MKDEDAKRLCNTVQAVVIISLMGSIGETHEILEQFSCCRTQPHIAHKRLSETFSCLFVSLRYFATPALQQLL